MRALAGLAMLVPAYGVSLLGGLWLGFVAMGLYLLAGLLALPAALLGLRRVLLKPVERWLGVPGRVALDSAANAVVIHRRRARIRRVMPTPEMQDRPRSSQHRLE